MLLTSNDDHPSTSCSHATSLRPPFHLQDMTLPNTMYSDIIFQYGDATTRVDGHYQLVDMGIKHVIGTSENNIIACKAAAQSKDPKIEMLGERGLQLQAQRTPLEGLQTAMKQIDHHLPSNEENASEDAKIKPVVEIMIELAEMGVKTPDFMAMDTPTNKVDKSTGRDGNGDTEQETYEQENNQAEAKDDETWCMV